MPKLYINGWVRTNYDGIISTTDKEQYSSWEVHSIPDAVESFAEENGVTREIQDGLGGTKSYIWDSNIYIYFTDKKSTFEEAQGSLICELYGDVETDIRLTGYSEYTITGCYLEEFTIGGHDLEAEISSHIGEYMHFVLEC